MQIKQNRTYNRGFYPTDPTMPSTQSFKYIPCLTGGATTYSKKLFSRFRKFQMVPRCSKQSGHVTAKSYSTETIQMLWRWAQVILLRTPKPHMLWFPGVPRQVVWSLSCNSKSLPPWFTLHCRKWHIISFNFKHISAEYLEWLWPVASCSWFCAVAFEATRPWAGICLRSVGVLSHLGSWVL